MAWCNNRLKAGKGKIMDCKKYMFIDTFPHCLDFCRAECPRHAARRCAGRGLCRTRPSSDGRGGRGGDMGGTRGAHGCTCRPRSGWEAASNSPT